MVAIRERPRIARIIGHPANEHPICQVRAGQELNVAVIRGWRGRDWIFNLHHHVHRIGRYYAHVGHCGRFRHLDTRLTHELGCQQGVSELGGWWGHGGLGHRRQTN